MRVNFQTTRNIPDTLLSMGTRRWILGLNPFSGTSRAACGYGSHDPVPCGSWYNPLKRLSAFERRRDCPTEDDAANPTRRTAQLSCFLKPQNAPPFGVLGFASCAAAESRVLSSGHCGLDASQSGGMSRLFHGNFCLASPAPVLCGHSCVNLRPFLHISMLLNSQGSAGTALHFGRHPEGARRHVPARLPAPPALSLSLAAGSRRRFVIVSKLQVPYSNSQLLLPPFESATEMSPSLESACIPLVALISLSGCETYGSDKPSF